jgi:hypothetical protein
MPWQSLFLRPHYLLTLSFRIFDSYGVDERDIVDKFAATACYAMTDFTNPLRRPRKIDPSVHCIHPAALGEQV